MSLKRPLHAYVEWQGHPKRFRMHAPIKNLSPEQALEMVMRLSEKGGRLREAVLAVVRNVLGEIDLDETADDVPIECAGNLLNQCRERGQDAASITPMNEFIRDRGPNWAGYLLRTGGWS